MRAECACATAATFESRNAREAAEGARAVRAMLALERMVCERRAARDEAKRKHEIAWDLMAMRNNAMHSDESVRVGRAFQPQPSDVFVVTYPKCGTTWVTQILHALRTAGSMDFGESTEVVPWDILAHDCGQKLDAAQVWGVRVRAGRHSTVSRPAASWPISPLYLPYLTQISAISRTVSRPAASSPSNMISRASSSPNWGRLRVRARTCSGLGLGSGSGLGPGLGEALDRGSSVGLARHLLDAMPLDALAPTGRAPGRVEDGAKHVLRALVGRNRVQGGPAANWVVHEFNRLSLSERTLCFAQTC